MLLLSLLSLLLTTPASPAPDWRTPFERGNGNTTATYEECLGYYQRLDAAYPEIQLSEAGSTDSGRPLHVVVVSGDGDMDPVSLRAKGRRIVFIQNGIHPGEPEGIDASLMLARDYVQQKALHRQLDDVTLVIIPIYNVGGALNRNSGTRTNQNGPESYGFRGNARNLDLNRDYIKQDSRNARSFAALFQRWQPDVYVDTHTSNGADYQYTLTLIATQKDKLHPALSQYMQQELLPALYGGMEQKKWYLTPYVDFAGRTPDARGLVGFLETPRYSTGYTTLFNTIGFVTETHMLKAYTPRVRATYDFLRLLIGTVQRQRAALGTARATAARQTQQQQQFALGWRLDTTAAEQFSFRGYAGKTKPSEVSGQPRLYYDRQAPYTKSLPYYNTFRPTTTVQRPRAYVMPQAWGEVVERLRLSGVQLRAIVDGYGYQRRDLLYRGLQNQPPPLRGPLPARRGAGAHGAAAPSVSARRLLRFARPARRPLPHRNPRTPGHRLVFRLGLLRQRVAAKGALFRLCVRGFGCQPAAPAARPAHPVRPKKAVRPRLRRQRLRPARLGVPPIRPLRAQLPALPGTAGARDEDSNEELNDLKKERSS